METSGVSGDVANHRRRDPLEILDRLYVVWEEEVEQKGQPFSGDANSGDMEAISGDNLEGTQRAFFGDYRLLDRMRIVGPRFCPIWVNGSTPIATTCRR